MTDTLLALESIGWERLLLLLMLVGFSLLALVSSINTHCRDGRLARLLLFRALCSSMGLGWSRRLLLYRVARNAGLTNPASLLLARGCYQHGRELWERRHGHCQILEQLGHDLYPPVEQ
ncbi:MAG: hypothetical protein CMJ32_04905 [Phycisphaerae bacterium]|nr:hypothetical protein [Phycisphaerae bacterium]